MTITQVTKLEILTPHPEHKKGFLLSHNPGGRILLREGKAVHAMGHNPETSKLRKNCTKSPLTPYLGKLPALGMMFHESVIVTFL